MKSNRRPLVCLPGVLLCLCFILFFQNSGSAQKGEAARKKIYISTIKATNLPESISDRVRNGIKLAIFEDYGTRYHVLDDEAIKIMFTQAEKIMSSGCDDISCITQIADGINADEIIYGDVSADGLKIKFNLTCLQRKGVELGTKSMVNVSFFESQIDHFISEASKKLMVPGYKININPALAIDTSISLKGISLGKIEGLDISVMRFTSTDEVIGQMLGFLKEMVEKGDKSFTDGFYLKAINEYNDVLNRIKTKLMPAQQAKMTDFTNGVKKRIGSAYAMDFKKQTESVDAIVTNMEKSDEKNLYEINSKYESIYQKISKIPNDYEEQTGGIKKSLVDRLDSVWIALAGYYEKTGDDAYREYKFEQALGLYNKSRNSSDKIANQKNKEAAVARCDKKIDAVQKTGTGYLANNVKTLIDQTSFYNLKDEYANAAATLNKTKVLIMGSMFVMAGVVDLYNEMAGILKAERLYFNKNTNRIEEDPGKIQQRQQAIQEEERKRDEKDRKMKAFWKEDFSLQALLGGFMGFGAISGTLGGANADYVHDKNPSLTDSPKDKPLFFYGYNIEPRVFMWYVGLGMNFSFYYSSTGGFNVGNKNNILLVSYDEKYKGIQYIPTFYIRPVYSKTWYWNFGVGYIISNDTITISTDKTSQASSLTVPPPVVNTTYKGKGSGFRVSTEAGFYAPDDVPLLIYGGIAYSYWKDDDLNIKGPSGESLTAKFKIFSIYAGFGVHI